MQERQNLENFRTWSQIFMD